MSSPKPEQFEEFYKAAYGKTDDPRFGPFPWQKRLAARVCSGDWPRAIALPTAAGKTACIDVAVFALACRVKDTPRRIFFVVDRRVVVDQAYEHAKKLAKVLDRAMEGVLHRAANALRDIAEPGWMALAATDRERILEKRWAIQDEQDEAKRQGLIRKLKADEREWLGVSPLDVYVLRGGMYRESAWARSPLQPTVVASTVDQVGSRLLFRGYGVSDSMKPVHAGLVGNDALILLDEAHCAKPFDQTMQAIKSYRTWKATDTPPQASFHFVSITATPTEDVVREEMKRQAEQPTEPKLIEEDEADDRDETKCVLGKRINAKKPATLVCAEKAKGKEWNKWGPPLVTELVEQARRLMGQDLGHDDKGQPHSVRAVGIIVNRVATARRLAETLRTPPGKKPPAEPLPKVILLTGRMRPRDRDQVLKELEPLFSGNSGEVLPTFVVATQCLEVGADLDFHALVTECASLDALRQRFGRLNRIAARPSAKAVIIVRGDQTESKEKESEQDPVYGNALPNTWQWLKKAPGDVFDFGVSAVREATKGVNLSPLNAPSQEAPVLFPAHLDCWVQTHPRPVPEPEPALFLHGLKQAGQPDVQVVFRADLGEDSTKWAEIVALCPPSSSEAVAVPIGVFKKWLADELLADDTADVEGNPLPQPEEEDEEITSGEREALRWKGDDSEETVVVVNPNDRRIRPGNLFVIPCSAPGAAHLGDFPTGSVADCAEEAFQRSRDKALLRLPGLAFPEGADDNETAGLVAAAIESQRTEFANVPEWRSRAVNYFVDPRNRYDLDKHPLAGFVITGKSRLYQFDPTYLDDTEPDESFRGHRANGRAVTLDEHSRGVADYAKRFAEGCRLDVALYTQAGLWHDLGKLDPRFQAMLKQSSPRTAVGVPLAKSARSPRTNEEQQQAREVHKYPKGARHELLSAALAATRTNDDLLLHLIATHHGSARPFATAVEENNAAREPFETPSLFGETFKLTTSAQQICDWNAELPERFWRVVRKYGWWGSAYHEVIFRLADHAQSAAEQERDAEPLAPSAIQGFSVPKLASRPDMYPLSLTGLAGSNPLAFLAALGTLRALTEASIRANPPEWLAAGVGLSWTRVGTARLHFARLPSQEEVLSELFASCNSDPNIHASAEPVDLVESKGANCRARVLSVQSACRFGHRSAADWLVALFSELVPEATSQLLVVRRDYLSGNIRNVLGVVTTEHLRRTLFEPWDYADALTNQSLHWEPSEDRRHAYQWYQPNGDPTRNRCGGMVGANRLALEAWPLFPSFPDGSERVRTRGFRGTRAVDTFWIWPLWSSCLTPDGVVSILSLPELQSESIEADSLRSFGVTAVYRSQRILVGKTPNLTPADAIA
jgi:CRISPR-associated endonuclease/helicase Cas3